MIIHHLREYASKIKVREDKLIDKHFKYEDDAKAHAELKCQTLLTWQTCTSPATAEKYLAASSGERTYIIRKIDVVD